MAQERNDTLFKRYEILVSAGAIAAHANYFADGFRQRDVRFLLELFSNWVEGSGAMSSLAVKNTQVLRYLELLCDEGYAKKSVRVKQPRYRLTRLGLLELLTRLSAQRAVDRREHFFFLYYFLFNYGPRIVELIKMEGKQFPMAMRIEIEALLDYRRLLLEEIQRTEWELRKYDERISDGLNAGRLATKLLAKGTPFDEVARELEQRYPYGLNSQKPLSELVSEIPRDIAQWELAVGNPRRAESIWQPARLLCRSYLDGLRLLERSLA